MRPGLVCALTVGAMLAGVAAFAQSPGGRLTTEQRDIGRVEARIEKYGEALGVVARLNRSPQAAAECNGICYFPSSSRAIGWRCAPKENCDLRCDVNPPVGGCR